MTTLHYSNEPATEDYPCVVKIDEDEILIEYEDDKIIQYRGKNNKNGHFELHSPEVEGKASLHRFPSNSLILEGSWIEGSYRGMWQIKLI